jgi:hypothetical protein
MGTVDPDQIGAPPRDLLRERGIARRLARQGHQDAAGVVGWAAEQGVRVLAQPRLAAEERRIRRRPVRRRRPAAQERLERGLDGPQRDLHTAFEPAERR